MTRLESKLISFVSNMLDPSEREAVLGDLVESGETIDQAIGDILGLVARRQIAALSDWRLGLMFACAIVPLGWLLSIISRETAGSSAVYFWMYLNNWDSSFLGNRGYWYELAHCIPIVVVPFITLTCWSWTAGLLLGLLSARTVPINGARLCLVLLLGEFVGAPLFFAYLEHLRSLALRQINPSFADVTSNDPVGALAFYRIVFPLLVLVLFVAIPALRGMQESKRATMLPDGVRRLLWAGASLTVAALVLEHLRFLVPVLALHRRHLLQYMPILSLISHGWIGRIVQAAVYWPFGWFLAVLIAERFRKRAASTGHIS